MAFARRRSRSAKDKVVKVAGSGPFSVAPSARGKAATLGRASTDGVTGRPMATPAVSTYC